MAGSHHGQMSPSWALSRSLHPHRQPVHMPAKLRGPGPGPVSPPPFTHQAGGLGVRHLLQHRLHELADRLEATSVLRSQTCEDRGGGTQAERPPTCTQAERPPTCMQAERPHTCTHPMPARLRPTLVPIPKPGRESPLKLSSVRFHSLSSSSVPKVTPNTASRLGLRRLKGGPSGSVVLAAAGGAAAGRSNASLGQLA